MLEFKEITKDKEISFQGFQKLYKLFPDMVSLFDLGVREFGSVVNFSGEGGHASAHGQVDGNKRKKNIFQRLYPPSSVPCMYCACALPHKKIQGFCIMETNPSRTLGDGNQDMRDMKW